MADLIVIGYDDEETASKAAAEVERLAQDLLIEPEAVAVIVRDQKGKYHVHTTHHPVAAGATWGMFWGVLFGLLFFVPVFGLAIGAAWGALFGLITKAGVDRQFQEEVRDMVRPGTSALFLIVDKVTPDKAIAALSRYGGRVLKTSLSQDAERQIQEALYGGAAAGQGADGQGADGQPDEATAPTTAGRPSRDDLEQWRGRQVVDPNGDKIGTIEEIYLDRQTGEPEWATVKTGLFGLKHNFIPIRDAEIVDDDTIRVPILKQQVKDSPKIDPDGELSPEEERRLWEHYGRSDYDEWQGEDRTTGLDAPDDRTSRAEPRADTAPGAADTAPDAASRSGGNEPDAAARPPVVGVRLRRYVVIVPDDGAAAQERTPAGINR